MDGWTLWASISIVVPVMVVVIVVIVVVVNVGWSDGLGTLSVSSLID